MHLFLSFFLCLLLARMYIAKCQSLRIGHTIRVLDVKPLLQDYNKPDSIPSMGGLFVNLCILITSFLTLKIDPFLILILLSLILFSILGLVDDLGKKDKAELSARTKFFLEFIFSCLFVYGLSFFMTDADKILIPFVKNPIAVSLYFSYPFMVFIIMATCNAVNLTDGLDGLAAGCSLYVFVTFAVLIWALSLAYTALLGLCFIVIGSILGFLVFNRYPAKVFMGDTGSLSLGAIMAMFAILLRAEFYLALVGLVFVLQTLSVILQVGCYRLKKKRLFLCAPIHHHFQMKGMSEKKVVLYMQLVTLILSTCAIGWIVCAYVL